MVNVVVSIISRDLIKPAAAAPSSSFHRKPYKLCLFDQFTPMTYVPMILFYPILDPNVVNIHQTLSHLKTSLSHTLSVYYPFSGRVKDNLYIDDFDAGVPYLEARINCRMFEFLKLQEIELLNQFVPYRSFCKETESHDAPLPLLAVQVSVFACGGITIGMSVSHKIFDGSTANTLCKCWASFFRGEPDQTLLNPNFDQASSTLPSKDVIPEKYSAIMEKIWFKEKNFVTRRFVFDAKAIESLQFEAKSEAAPNPTRIEALTCFIWKHAISASKYGNYISRKTFVAVQAVNMRPRMKPPMSENVIGNMVSGARAAYNPTDEKKTINDEDQLCDLVKLLHESIKGFDNVDYRETLQGEEGFRVISQELDQLHKIMNSLNPDLEAYTFSSWTKILNEVDFGWGRPFWIGFMGKPGPICVQSTVFIEIQRNKGIEAWVTLEEKQMTIMENNPRFLAFASPNQLVAK